MLLPWRNYSLATWARQAKRERSAWAGQTGRPKFEISL